MDPLSEILVSLRVESTAIAMFELRMPWSLDVVSFRYGFCYWLLEGDCWFISRGAKPRRLAQGECVIGPRGGFFVLSGSPGVVPTPADEVWSMSRLPHIKDGTLPRPVTLRWGGAGAQTRILALAFAFGSVAPRALLESLPEFFFLNAEGSGAIPWFRSAVEFVTAEKSEAAPGYGAVARELAQLIFTSSLRAHALVASEQPVGWLRALRDQKIARVLTAIHGRPGARWSVNALARSAGLSRSVFAARFRELTGQSPLKYLTAWRMRLAAERLGQGDVKMARLAQELGYGSERVFRRTFKRHLGRSPQEFRKHIDVTRTL